MIEIFENIRKLYEFETPCDELRGHIEFYSESSSLATREFIAESHFSIRMFPSWTPTFYINLGEPYAITIGDSRHAVAKDQDILILRNSIVERHNSKSDHIFTVKFHPGSLEALLGFPQHAVIGQMIDLKMLLPIPFLQRLKDQSSFADRVMLMQDFLLSRLPKKLDHQIETVKKAIALYDTFGMYLSNRQLADRTFTTSKTFNRYFHRVIGSPPKSYLQTVRVRNALISYTAAAESFSPIDFGYFDMSHFYKDVFHFTGQKLTELARLK
jgi:AraC-like DNA-binding protein